MCYAEPCEIAIIVGQKRSNRAVSHSFNYTVIRKEQVLLLLNWPFHNDSVEPDNDTANSIYLPLLLMDMILF